MTQESGTWRDKSAIHGGRAALRQALYMAALVAMRFNPDLKPVYESHVAPIPYDVIAIAFEMRKLIGLANALIRDVRIWSTKSA